MSTVIALLRRLLATKRGRYIVGGCVVGLIVIIAAASAAGSGGSDGSERTDQNTKKAATETAEDKDNRRKGFHCLSTWDGNHDGMNELIKAELNDPGSLDVHTTSIAPVEGGVHAVKVDFSAKNAFGGMVRNEATGFIDHDTCEATLWGIN